MTRLYIALFIGIFSNYLQAQDFQEILPSGIEGVTGGSVDFADIDNDQDQDVIVSGILNSGFVKTKLYINDENGVFTEQEDVPFAHVWHSSIAFSDIDNDNDQDLLVTGELISSQKTAKLYLNDGNGVFTEVLDTPFPGVNYSSIAFSDIDNDNDEDVLITGLKGFSPVSELYINDGNGVFSKLEDVPFEGVSFSNVAFSDIDNDGDKDLVISGRNSSNQRVTKLYTNDGNGVFTEVTGTPFEDISGGLDFADVDNNGGEDLIISGTNNEAQRITELFLNDGTGSFSIDEEASFVGTSASSVAFSDVNKDGSPDVLISGAITDTQNSTKLYMNNGSGGFSAITTPFNGVSGGEVAFSDIDNDNVEDVLITGEMDTENNRADLYKNTTVITAIEKIDPLFSQVSVYPNPNRGNITIDLGGLDDVSVKVVSLTGKLVYQKENINRPVYQFKLTASPGIYILELSSDGEKQEFKIVKK